MKLRHLKIVLLACLVAAHAPALAANKVSNTGQTNVEQILANFDLGGGIFAGTSLSGRLQFFTFFSTAGDNLTISTDERRTGLSLLFDPTGPTLESDPISKLNLLDEDDGTGPDIAVHINFTTTQTGSYAFAVGGTSLSLVDYNVTLTGNTGPATDVPAPAT